MSVVSRLKHTNWYVGIRVPRQGLSQCSLSNVSGTVYMCVEHTAQKRVREMIGSRVRNSAVVNNMVTKYGKWGNGCWRKRPSFSYPQDPKNLFSPSRWSHRAAGIMYIVCVWIVDYNVTVFTSPTHKTVLWHRGHIIPRIYTPPIDQFLGCSFTATAASMQ